MQKYFCDDDGGAYVPGADILKTKIKRLINVFVNANQPIIFTRHIDTPGSLMEKWWSENLKEDDPQSGITKDFDVARGEVFIKDQYDAFLNTDLESKLKKKGVKQVVICGVLTNLCCESTARSAFMRGFEVYFITDGTATYTKDMHDATLLNLKYGFATLLTNDEVIKTMT
ncbi:cysteine hydrolase [candidate division WOR-3 bacterium]|nr:cysteine hydrolase [candidate division WOR-3 bacterium]